MSLTCRGPVACQHNRKKSSAPLHQNQYNSKPHTSPEKRGSSAKGKPTPENQKETQVSKYKKNGKNTPSLDSSDSSTPAAVLWQLLFENTVFFLAKKPASLTGDTWEALQCIRWHHNATEGESFPFKVLKLIRTKMINIMPLYVGTYGGNYY